MTLFETPSAHGRRAIAILLSRYLAVYAPFLRLASQAPRMFLSIPILHQWRVSVAVSSVRQPSADGLLPHVFRPCSFCQRECKRTQRRNKRGMFDDFFFLHLRSGYAIFILTFGISGGFRLPNPLAGYRAAWYSRINAVARFMIAVISGSCFCSHLSTSINPPFMYYCTSVY